MDNIEIIDRKDCTGCGACAQACPQKCINMKPDEEGFLNPVTDRGKCASCGLCLTACHISENVELHHPFRGMAATAKDKRTYTESSSGGAFTLIAKGFINGKRGIVYGAAFTDHGEVMHIGIDKTEHLGWLQNSKYVQSETTYIYKEIKSLLDGGRKVLFSGTGCQVAALKTYLGREYDNLYLIDLICHGAPSPAFLKRHLKHLGISENDNVSFRHKGITGEVSSYCIKAPKKGYRDWSRDAYMNLFINCKSFRESCYKCRYAQNYRPGDLTIGDIRHTSIRNAEPLTSYTGLLINTQKGEELYDYLLEQADIKEIDMDIYFASNIRLSSPAKRPEDRDVIYPIVMAEPYDPSKLKPYMSKEPAKTKAGKAIKKFIPISVRKKMR